jgi:uncharacterized membrane protein
MQPVDRSAASEWGGDTRSINGLPVRFNNALPLLYLAWAMPFLVALAWLTPPFQNPDEADHYLRAVQIARGEVFAFRLAGSTGESSRNSGGHSDPGIVTANTPFSHLAFKPQQRVHKADYDTAKLAAFGKDDVIGFGDTANYPPFLYIPDIFGIWFGELVSGKVITSLYLSRLANAVAALTISALALIAARRTRSAIAALAMLPMTSALYVSASQDALIISLSLLVVGVIDRVGTEQRPASRGELVVIGIAAALVGMARPPYAVMALLPLAIRKRSSRRELLATLGISACTLVWVAFSIRTASVPMHGADAAVQLRHLLHSPWAILPLAWHTMTGFGVGYLREFIGVLGWLDTPLPRWFILAASAALGAGLLGVCASPSGPRPWLPVLVVILGSAAIFGAQYLTWTHPGAPFVDGVQGRYFIPLAAVLVLALPAAPNLIRPKLPWLSMAGIVFLANLAPAVVLRTIVLRYYLL